MRDDRKQVEEWARALLTEGTAIILDSETTGLDTTDEIVQLAVIDLTGTVLLDTYVKPSKPIPIAAQRIHGITDAMVADAPTFDQIAPKIRELLSGITVVIYNAAYDERVLEQSAAACGLTIDVPIFGAFAYECCMEQYAVYYGDWSDYYQKYKWRPLPGGDHSAKGDALATLALIKRMAGHVDIGVAKEQL